MISIQLAVSNPGATSPHRCRPASSVLTVALALLAAGVGAQQQPGNLTAVHRSGQTFLTWSERGDLTLERYRVYRHTVPITAASFSGATRLYEVVEGSGQFWSDRYPEGDVWRSRYVERFVIVDGGPQLPAGIGLLVWTLHPDELGGATSGRGYYAVTTVNPSGQENTTDFSPGNTAGPVDESVADPLPVEIAGAGEPGGHVFIQYMDVQDWNPSFHAPNPSNGYLGLPEPGETIGPYAGQYAYTYVVGEPGVRATVAPDDVRERCGDTVPAVVPLILYLHGHEGNIYPPDRGYSQYYCAFEIRPVDLAQTWFFGFARQHDYRQDGWPEAGDVIVNYTEQRLLRMVGDLLRHQTLGARIDPERIYVYGHSMGGSGTLALALRYPNVFAAAYASEPMTRYSTSGDGGGIDWREDVGVKWGAVAQSLPVALAAPFGWGQHLARYNGTGVWDWQNHQATMTTRAADETVPFGVAHGRQDTAIEWPTQGKPFYAEANAARRCWGGMVLNAEHTWLAFAGLPPGLAVDQSYLPFGGLGARLHESVPALSNASGDFPLPPPDSGEEGGYNQAIEWSSSWSSWDGPPLDTATSWGVSLRATDGLDHRVDVTPRRLQHFRVMPGTSVTWENHQVSDDALVESGSVTADSSGLVTVPRLGVSPTGNRLRLALGSGGNRPPVAFFTATPSSGRAPLTVAFDASASSDPDGTITSFSWSFGDGSSGSGSTTSHTFSDPGSYTVHLTVTDNAGTSASTTRSVAVQPAAGGPRPFPDTSAGVHVFPDQLPGTMSDEQVHFAATHYDGTQKMTRSDADRLRAVNPDFFILHYRLGLGLGYRAADAACQPTGDWLHFIEGNDWVREWPATEPPESYLYHWPESSTTRVFNCDWGWYVTAIDSSAFRDWWVGEINRQLAANAADGVFMDSFSVINYLGHDHYRPTLPEIDETFETAWAARIAAFLEYLGPRVNGWLVPNVGMWVTSRETTDYSPAHGLMIEQFAMESDASPLALADWQLQMNRALGAIRRNQALIGQSYVSGNQERLFCLGSYLLIKGSRTYLTLMAGDGPEWWPEYDVPIGTPVAGPVAAITALDPDGDGVFRRDFDNGLVLVNATSPGDDTAVTRTLELGRPYALAVFSGGGEVATDGTTTARVTYRTVTSVTLPPSSAAVLLAPGHIGPPRRHLPRPTH